MSSDSPIIILSSERSGSNLLRSLFSNHSQVDGPVSPQFTDPFLKNLHRYGRIENRLNAVRLIEDMLLYSKHRYSAWDIESTGEAIYEKYQPRSFFGVLFALYSEKSLANGKITFFCKENILQKHALAWHREFPRTKYIYLLRDPRDVVSSWKKKPLKHMATNYQTATRWEEEQRYFLGLLMGFDLPIVTSRYEDLVKDPASEMTKILEACGLPVEVACFETQKNAQGAGTHVYWENINKPIVAGNAGRFSERLSTKEIRVIESICADVMCELGYSCLTDASWRPKCGFTVLNKIRGIVRLLMNRDHVFRHTRDFINSRRKLFERISKHVAADDNSK